MKIVIILFLFLLGCGSQENPTISDKDTPPEREPPKTTINYYSLDKKAVDPDVDDMILECADNNGFEVCETICISEAYPEIKRYDLYMTYYLPVDSCEFYIFESSSEAENGSYEFYQGEYSNHNCINFQLIDEGNYYFDTRLDYLYLYEGEFLKESVPISSPGTGIFKELDVNHEFFLRDGCKKLDDLTDEFIENIII